MCGYGSSDNDNICIYLGYYGSYIGVNDKYYNPYNDKEVKKKSISKKEIKKLIKEKYTYTQFIDMILGCIENGGEI